MEKEENIWIQCSDKSDIEIQDTIEKQKNNGYKFVNFICIEGKKCFIIFKRINQKPNNN